MDESCSGWWYWVLYCTLPFLYVFLDALKYNEILVYCLGMVKWYSLLWRNQGSLLFAPPRLEWSDQVVLITGGTFQFQSLSSGVL